jgi:hypothetical protein
LNRTKSTTISKVRDQQPNNGDEHIPTVQQREDSYNSAYEAGVASGKEEGYRQGYREGFADCIKFGNPAPGAADTRDTSNCGSRETAGSDASRLRGLPCAKCGCPSYSNEVQCPRCRTQKVAAVGKQLAAVEES